MQNQAAVEALYSATFVEDYLDYVENVPDDLQRQHSRMRELDMSQHQELLSELDTLVTEFEAASEDPALQRRLLAKMQLPLINSQDIGDSKIQLVQGLTDTIENKTRQLEHDSQNLDFGRGEEEEGLAAAAAASSAAAKTSKKEPQKRKKKPEEDEEAAGGKAAGPPKAHHPPSGKKVKKAGAGSAPKPQAPVAVPEKREAAVAAGASSSNPKRGAKKVPEKERSTSPPDLANVDIDPDEPTYCLCDQVSYGEMIGCDNDLCPIEWFHFNCVQLGGKPKGKWFCPKCRGDKPTNMKPKAQFLKSGQSGDNIKEINNFRPVWR